ncbi:glycoside hydrolase family 31 protein [Durotheca rogersii]|uniref:glycoside hydrolase family 31 protein n=1 Tax=Durotheca rogersii TaxID=419775 RepID=UPI002220F652|nr:glycoside hydrolase family 31 protein [Durotheca rogersii]KAI5863805.1 glycoside hydrolase family 31 protein [Durotheca rogersii]
MFQQKEHVPKNYVLDGTHEEASPAAAPSLSLVSTYGSENEKSHFTFEAVRPNIYRTTFTTSQHPLPPYPSTKRLEPTFGDVSPKVSTDAGKNSQEIDLGSSRAVVNWTNAPVVSLFLEGKQKPIHQDLEFRSYAVDGNGTAHYTAYRMHSLHVGLGEKAAPMNLSGRGFAITASDTFGYEAYRTDPLYKHVPLLINATPEGCVGIFSTSHSRASWAIGSEIDGLWGRFKVYRQSYGGLEEYLIVGKTVAEVVRSYAELVGFPLLVPRYMMGYVGGGMKYSMEDSPRARDVIYEFISNCEKHGMPCSAFQMSSGYTVAETEPKTRNVFTWNRHRFPDPRAFTRECHRRGVRLLANIKPYVLANHPAYPELSKTGAFFKDPATGTTAVARLWSAGGGESGEGSHLDFSSKAGYNWWYNGVKALKEVGIDAMWNDNNEYNTPDDDWQLALETVTVPPGETRNHIGLWGRAMNTELVGKSSHDATLEAEPNLRPFVLTRSATAGTMRYCASSWSGDNVTSWEGMKGANSLALNAGFSLLQCYGHDIGGFEGPQPTPEHLVRWIQLGIHSPRFAINCYKTNPDDNLVGEVIEPWQYPSVIPIIRDAIRRRYELVPYTYSLMLKSHREAVPPQRWTGWGFESDPTVWTPELYQGDTQYWFGDALLVAGVYEPGASSARVYLPDASGSDLGFLSVSAPYQYLAAGQWHDVASAWHDSIPVLARVGAAVPVGKPEPTTSVAGEDAEFPNLAKDDYRGVEIFPPPRAQLPHWPKGHGELDLLGAAPRWFRSAWLEDDGASVESKADAAKITVAYGVSASEIRVKVDAKKEGAFEPLWLKNGIVVVLPVGEERAVKDEDGGDGHVKDLGRDDKARRIFRVDVDVLSRENFEVFQRYGDPVGSDPRHRTVTIYASPDAQTTYVERDLKLDSLPSFFRPRPSSGAPRGVGSAASLKLVVVDSMQESWSNSYRSLWLTKDVFLALVDTMGMDPAALWLLRNEYDGFHYFTPSSSSPSPSSSSSSVSSSSSTLDAEKEGRDVSPPLIDTYYIGTSSFVLIWTYDRRGADTRALWVLRQQQQQGIPGGSVAAAWFANVLRRHREHVRSPFLLGYVAALATCCTFDGEIAYRAHVVRLVERQTGYSTHSSGIEDRLGIDSLTVSITEIGGVLNHIVNNERHFRLVDSVLDFFRDALDAQERGGNDHDPDPHRRAARHASTRKLVAAIPLLKRRMHASQEFLKYLKERVERLSTVLFALLTHEDSATHAELAAASRRIAEASQRDSSSMKTVAVMTMAFLPATFVAALFALPSLDWRAPLEDGPAAVVQPYFWVYWAVTLPATGLVFALWFLLDRTAAAPARADADANPGASPGGNGIRAEDITRRHWLRLNGFRILGRIGVLLETSTILRFGRGVVNGRRASNFVLLALVFRIGQHNAGTLSRPRWPFHHFVAHRLRVVFVLRRHDATLVPGNLSSSFLVGRVVLGIVSTRVRRFGFEAGETAHTHPIAPVDSGTSASGWGESTKAKGVVVVRTRLHLQIVLVLPCVIVVINSGIVNSLALVFIFVGLGSILVSLGLCI